MAKALAAKEVEHAEAVEGAVKAVVATKEAEHAAKRAEHAAAVKKAVAEKEKEHEEAVAAKEKEHAAVVQEAVAAKEKEHQAASAGALAEDKLKQIAAQAQQAKEDELEAAFARKEQVLEEAHSTAMAAKEEAHAAAIQVMREYSEELEAGAVGYNSSASVDDAKREQQQQQLVQATRKVRDLEQAIAEQQLATAGEQAEVQGAMRAVLGLSRMLSSHHFLSMRRLARRFHHWQRTAGSLVDSTIPASSSTQGEREVVRRIAAQRILTLVHRINSARLRQAMSEMRLRALCTNAFFNRPSILARVSSIDGLGAQINE
jgi:hypothetical protein